MREREEPLEFGGYWREGSDQQKIQISSMIHGRKSKKSRVLEKRKKLHDG
jgi:hypothetical protein